MTVVYNALEDLKITIDSVLNQDYDNVEYIIKDGASTDGTASFIKTLHDQNLLAISTPDNGIYDAMNQAIDLATGDWIIFMNAGDEFAAFDTLSQASMHLDLSFDFIYGDRYRTEINGIKSYQKAGEVKDTLLREVVFHQSLFNKAKTLKDKKYSREYSLASDYHYIVSSHKNEKKFKYIEIPICNFKCGGRIKQQSIKFMVEALKISIDHQSDPMSWQNSDFFKTLILNNIKNVFDRELSRLSSTYGKELLFDFTNEKLNIYPESNDENLKSLIEQFTAPLNHMNIKDITSENKKIPKISVVTVVFNDKEGISRTITSIRQLIYENIEFIVIDGNSTDGTKDVVIKNNDIVDVFISEKDDGIYDAMNKGIDLSTGDFIIFMNAGDEFASKDVIDKAFTQSNWKESDVIYGDRFYIDTNGNSTFQKAMGHENINKRMPFGHQSVFVKSTELKKLKFNTAYKSAADYNQFVHLYKTKKSFEYIPIPICKFYAGGTSENGMLPYLEVLKIQIENFGLDDVKSNSIYYVGFKNNLNKFFN